MWAEAASPVLGHGSAAITNAIYANWDHTRIENVMRGVG